MRRWRMMRTRLAPITCARSSAACGVRDRPSRKAEATGKNTISTVIATLGAMPKPSHRVRMGARAKTGMVWLKVRIGRSTPVTLSENPIATASAAPSAEPSRKPSITSARVKPAWVAISARFSHRACATAPGEGSRKGGIPASQIVPCHSKSTVAIRASTVLMPSSPASGRPAAPALRARHRAGRRRVGATRGPAIPSARFREAAECGRPGARPRPGRG